MKKLLFTGSLLSLISVYGNTKEEIITKIYTLQTKIENREKRSRYNTIISYSALAVGIATVCIAKDKLSTFMYSFASWGGISGILALWNILQVKQCRYLFKALASKRVNSFGEVIDNKYSHLSPHSSYLISDDLFLLLGIKSGFSESELIDLAKTLGRLETAYKLKILTIYS